MTLNEALAFLKQNKQLIKDNDFNTLFDLFPEPEAGRWLLDLLWDWNDKYNIIGHLKEEIPGYFACGSQKIKSIGSIPTDSDFETIGPFAFNDSSITSVRIPSNIKLIGEYAFSSCHNLKDVILEPSLERMEAGAFGACENLNIIFNGDLEQWNAIDIDTQDVPFTEDYKLNGKFSTNKFIIPDTTQRVKNYKFAHVSNLNELEIHCRIIGDGAFNHCSNLKTALVDSWSIGEFAFADCDSLETVHLTSKVELIKAEAFAECPLLKRIDYDGTKDEFTALKISEFWLEGCAPVEVHCKDGILHE